MCASEPLDDPVVVCETVVVHYFTAIGGFELLAAVLDGTVHVPAAVFDPDEDHDLADEALSELRRGLRLHEHRAGDPKVADHVRERSASVLPHFRKLDDHAAEGSLRCVALTEDELRQFAQLRTFEHVRQFGLKAPLGRGEAAVLAVATSRGWEYATDDNDAITVGQTLMPQVTPWRIRRLLLECVTHGLCTQEEAERAHDDMVRLGFWDRGAL